MHSNSMSFRNDCTELKWPHMWRLATIAGTTAQAGITEVTPISWAFAYQSSYYCMEEKCHMLHNLQNAYNLYCGSARMPDESTDVRENYTINVSFRKMTILQNLLGDRSKQSTRIPRSISLSSNFLMNGWLCIREIRKPVRQQLMKPYTQKHTFQQANILTNSSKADDLFLGSFCMLHMHKLIDIIKKIK